MARPIQEIDMPWTKETRSGRGLSAKTLTCVTFTALLACGSFAGPAVARDNDNDHQKDWHDNRNDRQDWNRDYYRAPPVVYGRYSGPTYYAPPIVYGSGSGLGLTINVQ
jgi:hypothetical protein